MSDAIPCPGSTASRQHVIARDARVCHICGWVRGERNALSLQPQKKAPPPAPTATRRPRRWLVEVLLVAASIGTVAFVAIVAGFRLP